MQSNLKAVLKLAAQQMKGLFCPEPSMWYFVTVIIDQLEPCAVQCKLCETNNETNCGHELSSDQLVITAFILLDEKFLQFDWLRAVVFQLNLKYLHVKITNLCG